MVDIKQIQEVATKIGKQSNAESVVLFGSYVRNEARENSDVDLLVIAESQLAPHKRARDIYKSFTHYPFSMDILIYTPQEVEKLSKEPLSFISTILNQGRVLYEKA